MLRKILHKISVTRKMVSNYRETKRQIRTNHVDPARPVVFFDLTDVRQEPYYYPIIFSFHQRGYTIALADNWRFIGHSFGPARFIYELPNLGLAREAPPQATIIISDRGLNTASEIDGLIYLRLRPTVLPPAKAGGLLLPYPMHPSAYHSGRFAMAPAERATKRKCRVLFSGNVDPVAYRNPLIAEKHAMMNRVAVIDKLLQSVPAAQLKVVREQKDNVWPASYFPGVRLHLWRWSPQDEEGLDIRVPNDQWLHFLAHSDFFLCCPGIVIPQSHNAVEAMSVGTIPILQYGSYFNPALEHGVHCIGFTDASDLPRAIATALSMSTEAILSMRSAVIDYYEAHLAATCASRLIEALGPGTHEGYFSNEAQQN